ERRGLLRRKTSWGTDEIPVVFLRRLEPCRPGAAKFDMGHRSAEIIAIKNCAWRRRFHGERYHNCDYRPPFGCRCPKRFLPRRPVSRAAWRRSSCANQQALLPFRTCRSDPRLASAAAYFLRFVA